MTDLAGDLLTDADFAGVPMAASAAFNASLADNIADVVEALGLPRARFEVTTIDQLLAALHNKGAAAYLQEELCTAA